MSRGTNSPPAGRSEGATLLSPQTARFFAPRPSPTRELHIRLAQFIELFVEQDGWTARVAKRFGLPNRRLCFGVVIMTTARAYRSSRRCQSKVASRSRWNERRFGPTCW